MTASTTVEFDTPHAPALRIRGRRESLTREDSVWFGSTFVYPTGSRYASDAWHSPFIAVGSEVVWRGEPAESAVIAEQSARTKLATAMRSLLASD